MTAIRMTWRRLRANSRGATAIEYGLIAALIAIAAMGGMKALGGGVGGSWGIIGEKSGAHGLDEKVWIEGFHGQVPITVELLRRLAG